MEGGPALDMIAMNVTTDTNSVGTMDIIAYRATKAVDGKHERRPAYIDVYTVVYKKYAKKLEN